MSDFRFLEVILVALWLIGSALATGMVISRRDKKDPISWFLYFFALIFSWIFVGWMTFEMLALIIQGIWKNQFPRRDFKQP
jgi:hypothetical protein